MLLPVRCFTCNRVLADEKLAFFERSKGMSQADIIATYKACPDGAVCTPRGLKRAYSAPDKIGEVSPTVEFHLMNLMGIDNVCCRRMYMSYVNLVKNIN